MFLYLLRQDVKIQGAKNLFQLIQKGKILYK